MENTEGLKTHQNKNSKNIAQQTFIHTNKATHLARNYRTSKFITPEEVTIFP